MKKITAKTTTRKPRSDAQRNRLRILEVAKECFARHGLATSMDQIGKRARIGAGTLYRHFPTRDDLLAAVYITEVEKLAEAQRRFSDELGPVDALRRWMLVFIDYTAAKKIIAPALNAMAGGPSRVYEQTNRVMEEAAHALAARAVADGLLRAEVDPMDMFRALYGVASAGSGEEGLAKARMFVDVLIRGWSIG